MDCSLFPTPQIPIKEALTCMCYPGLRKVPTNMISLLTAFLSLTADPSPPEPPINVRVSNQTLDWTASQTGPQLTKRYAD